MYQNQTDAAKGNALKAFLNYIYGPGQETAPTIDYAPLSKGLLTQAKAQVSKIVVPAGRDLVQRRGSRSGHPACSAHLPALA